MIDVHCHLNFHSFKNDTDEVIKKAFDAGLTRIINTGTQVSSSRHAIELAEKYENLYAIVGIHPHHADKLTSGHPEFISGSSEIPDPDFTKRSERARQVRNDIIEDDKELPFDWINDLEKMTKHPKVIGIGECGMDFYPYSSNGVVKPTLQEKVFEEQIKLSHRSQLPLQIHNRQAGEKVIGILKRNKNLLQPVPGMFHCFAGSSELLEEALELGFYIGFDGNVTYDGIAKGETTDLKEIAKKTPLERIVIETDSPYLTPIPHRGERNEPQYAIIVGQFIADLKGIPYSKLVESTTKNVYTIFTKLK